MPIVFTIDPADARPIYVQIMDEVRRGLAVGTLAPDEPLPSVRQLAADLRVNPNTVQQAWRELEREGLIYVRRGQGTFVAETVRPEHERRTVSRHVAERALRDAFRHGLTRDELIATLEQLEPSGTDITDETEKRNTKGADR